MARGRRRRRHPKLGLLLLFSVNTRERSLARVLGRPRPRPAAPAVAGPSHGGDARELLLADESNWLSEQSLLLIDSPIVEARSGVIVVEVEARIAWRMSLSWRTQWEFATLEAAEFVPSMVGHYLSPVTKSMRS
ncbi:uncharacterized protein LOC103716330 isoform X3 [Phoenix dactylifera]|uniref:Uncharacterized protein LOC103716330 isoform X3 n=1 Tax=Phoenix dactylifera TaxID=42345 RepID=A0A8B8ZJL9_PHODC|nr:uncharacterized protein LOC103716330 isoform X3 [Phoenix dactylifera]